MTLKSYYKKQQIVDETSDFDSFTDMARDLSLGESTLNDTVNNPAHYTQGKIEVLDFILDQDLPYLPGQVIKYICRYRFKNGLEDLQKAEFYLKRLIEELE